MVPVVGFDFRMAHYYGIGTYIFHLLKAALESSLEFRITLFGKREEAHPFLADERFSFQPFLLSPYSWKGHFFFKEKAAFYPLFHFPHYNASFFCKNFVLTIHDLIPLLFPRSLSQPLAYPYVFFWHWQSIKRARYVICVSYSTKKDIQRFFGVPDEKIKVIYEGVDKKVFYPLTLEEKKKFLQKMLYTPFFLYVGGAKFHKNLPCLLEAFSYFVKKTSFPHYLLLVGISSLPYFKRWPELRKRVVFVPSVKRERLRFYYGTAEALIYPSFYEGFGLPPLEASSCSCPVLCAATSSLPEIYRTQALYFSPFNPYELFYLMIEIATKREKREVFAERAREGAERFSWQRAFHRTYQIYQACLD